MKTPTEALAEIAAIIAETGNTTATPAAPWFIATGPAPTAAGDPNNEDEIKRYAAHGFKIDLTRGVAPSDFPAMLDIVKRLQSAATQADAENAIARASLFPPDVASVLVFTGCTQGFSPFMTPTIFAPQAIQTVLDASAYATQKWTGGAGPGIG